MGSQAVALEMAQCLITLEATVDRLAMAEALSIPEALTQHGANLLRQVLRIQLAQVVQVQLPMLQQ